MNFLSAMAHNDSVCRGVENKLNDLIEEIHDLGGEIWLTKKYDKDFCVKLPDNISITYYQPIKKEK